MASVVHRDSDLFFFPVSPSPAGEGTDGGALNGEIPTFDLNSTGPLPILRDVPTGQTAPPLPADGLSDPSFGEPTSSGFWLEGNVIMCPCPECRAPMSIRLWLMIADCWRCGTSIELTEEQEREVQRLLEKRDKARRPAELQKNLTPSPPPQVKASPPTSAHTAPPVPTSRPAEKTDNSNPVRRSVPASPPPERSPKSPEPSIAPGSATGTAAAPTTRFKGDSPSAGAFVATPSPQRNAPAPLSSSPHAPPPAEMPVPAAPSPTRPSPRPTTQAPVASAAPAPPLVRPTPARRPQPSVLMRRRKESWLRRTLRDVPAWFISLILHMVMILLLALITFQEKHEAIFILVSTVVSRERTEGEFKTKVEKEDELKFDLPVPDNLNLKNKKMRDALIEADKNARELRIDPDTPAPSLADLSRVKELVASDDPVRRSLAVRDPRLRVEIAKKEGGTTLTEAAVSRGLRWLAGQQKNSGSWGHGGEREMADTALAVLPFLGAGQTHTTGKYQENVSKGLRWMMQHQKEDGDLRGGSSQHPGMYSHGIASIVLCDAFGMTGDEQLRQSAQKAIDFIVAAQNQEGGWRYFPRKDADLSVVGWQLMALQSGKMSGLSVPKDTLELTDHYLDTVGNKGGSQYSYQRRAAPTATMTAEGLLCRMYLGWNKDNPGLTRGVEYLTSNHLPSKSERNIYYWYYGTQVFHHAGGTPWEKWNERMRDILVETQVNEGINAGSWNPEGDRWGAAGGRIFQTALSTCTLEVYYRHAPIYRKIKLD